MHFAPWNDHEPVSEWDGLKEKYPPENHKFKKLCPEFVEYIGPLGDAFF